MAKHASGCDMLISQYVFFTMKWKHCVYFWPFAKKKKKKWQYLIKKYNKKHIWHLTVSSTRLFNLRVPVAGNTFV